MSIRVLIIEICLLSALPCFSQQVLTFDTSVGVRKDIPVYGRAKRNFHYETVKMHIKQLGLDSMEGGVDSFQCRIWFGHSLAYKQYLFDISYVNGRWQGAFYTFFKKAENELPVKGVDNKYVLPDAEDWGKFLISYEIGSIPQGPGGGMDGILWRVEYATKNKYRFYTWWCPELNEGISVYSGKMIAVVQFIKKRCGIDEDLDCLTVL